MSVTERIFGQHCNTELPHVVSQESPHPAPALPSFHRLTPAIVHVCSVDSLMLLLKPINPEGIASDKTPYLPAAQSVHVEAPACEDLPAAQSVHVAVPMMVLYVPATHGVHVPTFPVVPAAHPTDSHKFHFIWKPAACPTPSDVKVM